MYTIHTFYTILYIHTYIHTYILYIYIDIHIYVNVYCCISLVAFYLRNYARHWHWRSSQIWLTNKILEAEATN